MAGLPLFKMDYFSRREIAHVALRMRKSTRLPHECGPSDGQKQRNEAALTTLASASGHLPLGETAAGSAVQARWTQGRPSPHGRSFRDPYGETRLPAKQRGSPAQLFSGLGPWRLERPVPFAETPESCQAKSEPYGTKSAFPLGAGHDPPPPSNSGHGCGICLRRSLVANHLA